MSLPHKIKCPLAFTCSLYSQSFENRYKLNTMEQNNVEMDNMTKEGPTVSAAEAEDFREPVIDTTHVHKTRRLEVSLRIECSGVPTDGTLPVSFPFWHSHPLCSAHGKESQQVLQPASSTVDLLSSYMGIYWPSLEPSL